MARNIWLQRLVMLPLSKIYGSVVYVRNKMFDWGILRQHEFDVPVIVVGNLAAGGTGKTPHVEFIVDMLRHDYHIGVLSRGYNRYTKGFVMAGRRSTPADIGDEPYQIYHKFDSSVVVAVCEDRVKGIEELLRIDPKINLIVLDDAFQHRYVKPAVSVVITEYNRPVFEDDLLPYGNLRESKDGLHRADIVVVSKCNDKTKALDFTIFTANLDLSPYQKLFFTKMQYGTLKPVFPDMASPVAPSLEWLTADDMILTIAGIGNPRPFVKYIKRMKPKVRVNIFPDHHNFTRKDMDLIRERFNSLSGVNNYIITTEKDAVRLANNPYFPHEIKPYVYYLPISVGMVRDTQADVREALVKMIKSKTH